MLSEILSETLPEMLSEILSETLPEMLSEIISETILETLSETIIINIILCIMYVLVFGQSVVFRQLGDTTKISVFDFPCLMSLRLSNYSMVY